MSADRLILVRVAKAQEHGIAPPAREVLPEDIERYPLLRLASDNVSRRVVFSGLEGGVMTTTLGACETLEALRADLELGIFDSFDDRTQNVLNLANAACLPTGGEFKNQFWQSLKGFFEDAFYNGEDLNLRKVRLFKDLVSVFYFFQNLPTGDIDSVTMASLFKPIGLRVEPGSESFRLTLDKAKSSIESRTRASDISSETIDILLGLEGLNFTSTPGEPERDVANIMKLRSFVISRINQEIHDPGVGILLFEGFEKVTHVDEEKMLGDLIATHFASYAQINSALSPAFGDLLKSPDATANFYRMDQDQILFKTIVHYGSESDFHSLLTLFYDVLNEKGVADKVLFYEGLIAVAANLKDNLAKSNIKPSDIAAFLRAMRETVEGKPEYAQLSGYLDVVSDEKPGAIYIDGKRNRVCLAPANLSGERLEKVASKSKWVIMYVSSAIKTNSEAPLSVMEESNVVEGRLFYANEVFNYGMVLDPEGNPKEFDEVLERVKREVGDVKPERLAEELNAKKEAYLGSADFKYLDLDPAAERHLTNITRANGVNEVIFRFVSGDAMIDRAKRGPFVGLIPFSSEGHIVYFVVDPKVLTSAENGRHGYVFLRGSLDNTGSLTLLGQDGEFAGSKEHVFMNILALAHHSFPNKPSPPKPEEVSAEVQAFTKGETRIINGMVKDWKNRHSIQPPELNALPQLKHNLEAECGIPLVINGKRTYLVPVNGKNGRNHD